MNIKGLLFCGIGCLLVLTATVAPASAQSVTLAWDASTDADVTGYRVYYGRSRDRFTGVVDAGAQTIFTVSGIDTSQEHYFAVQAYTSTGLSSAISEPVVWTPAVPAGTTVIDRLKATSASPFLAGTTVTWTASARSTAGPVEYQFWKQSGGVWHVVQAYSQNATFTWTPGWGDVGAHTLQVWARTVGSPARYEAWVATDRLVVSPVPVQLTSDTAFPAAPGTPVTWTASATGGSTPLEYRFWLLSNGTWSVLRDWSSSNTAAWIPQTVGSYAVQVWVRRVGVTANYETWAGSGMVTIAVLPVRIVSFSADRTFPQSTGTRITWTAKATGGSRGPLQYQFWRLTRNGWIVAQPWSRSNTYTWQPTWGDVGTSAVQVWVRSDGSTAPHEAWQTSGVFTITPAEIHLSSNVEFPAAPGTAAIFRAEVADPLSEVEYQFWLYDRSTGQWSNAQPYSSSATFTWTPSGPGTFSVQVWVRKRGSPAKYDTWRGTDYLTVKEGPVRLLSMTSDPTIPGTSGTPITWTTRATQGSAQLQYQYWVFRQGYGWSVGRGWSTDRTWTWTPSAAGEYAVQVWVRSTGVTAPYEAWLSSGMFMITP